MGLYTQVLLIWQEDFFHFFPHRRPPRGTIMALRLKQALASGRLVRVFCLGQVCHPKLMEMLGIHGGWDGVWLDQEHAGLTIPQIEEAARGGRAAGLDTFVRLPATDYAAVMRPLEAGAGGIMASMVKSGAEAEQIVRWAKDRKSTRLNSSH